MTTDINLLSSKTPVSSLPPIHTANGTKMTITHTGHVTTPNLSLPEMYHIPNLTLNLISVGQLCEKELTFIFSSSGFRYRIHKRDRFLERVAKWVDYLSLHHFTYLRNLCLLLQPQILPFTNGIFDLDMPQLAKFNL
jgi:hypothetical protein